MWLAISILTVAFLLTEFAVQTRDLMCYQCSDSSDKKGANDCQTYVRTMKYNRKKFYETGEMRKYIKNCTAFAGVENVEDLRCLTMWVEAEGNIRTFIRDCTEGTNFFNADYNAEFKDVTPNNKSECITTKQGYLACVTMCDYEMGDFCNGPSRAGSVHVSWALFSLIAVLWILGRYPV